MFKKSHAKSLLKLWGAVVLLIAALISARGGCCSEYHRDAPAEYAGESVEVCVCLCHAMTAFDENGGRIPTSVPEADKHSLADEIIFDSAFVAGIDHPPKV